MSDDFAVHLTNLAKKYDNFSVVFVGEEDFARCRANLEKLNHATATQLPDGRGAVTIIHNVMGVRTILRLCNVTTESWLQFRKFEDKTDTTHRVANFEGRHVRVHTGMLTNMLCYIVAAAARWSDTNLAIEEAQYLPLKEFDAKYERLAATANFNWMGQSTTEAVSR